MKTHYTKITAIIRSKFDLDDLYGISIFQYIEDKSIEAE